MTRAIDHPYQDWAPYWDLLDVDRGPMLAFYRGLLTPDRRSLIDLACGTGTITAPLAQDLRRIAPECRVVGVDRSPEMLRYARARDAGVEWILGEIAAPPVEGRFDLAICCFNTLQETLVDDRLAAAFRAVGQLLGPGGVFAFDVYQPNLEWLAAPLVDYCTRRAVDAEGRQLEVRENTSYDHDARVLTFDWRLIERQRPTGAPLARMRYRMRQYFPAEIERLVAAGGLVIRERYGDFDRSRFTPRSKKQVVVCGKAAG
jgi:SAM-dependent methyltransferase